MSGLAGRYASALLDLADEKKQLDAVADDLRGLRGLLQESASLRKLSRSPLFSRRDQANAMTAVLGRAGVSELTRRFILVVVDNRRLFALSDMIDAYLEELARRRGEIAAQVTSAVALDDERQKALTEALRSKLGGKVNVEMTVDPDLIGGLVVKVGSRMIDSSLRSKLQRLKLAMKGVG